MSRRKARTSPDNPHDITDAAQLEAVIQPVRMEIVDRVAQHSPCSIRDLSDWMGRARPALYFHVEKLVEVGLLLPAGERGKGRRREALYRTPGTPVDVVFDRDDPLVVESTVRYASNILARAKRAVSAAFGSGGVTTRGPRRDTHVDQTTCWLDEARLAELNGHLDAIRDLVTRSPRREGARLLLVTVALARLDLDRTS